MTLALIHCRWSLSRTHELHHTQNYTRPYVNPRLAMSVFRTHITRFGGSRTLRSGARHLTSCAHHLTCCARHITCCAPYLMSKTQPIWHRNELHAIPRLVHQQLVQRSTVADRCAMNWVLDIQTPSATPCDDPHTTSSLHVWTTI